MDKLISAIEEHKNITIFGHENPDGDCIGSQFGLKHIILNNFTDKEVRVLGQSSDYIDFLDVVDEVSDEFIEESLAIVVDTSNSIRISDQRYKLAKKTIKIDHHIVVEQYGDLNFEDSETPATAQLILRYASINNWTVPDKAAEALYTGIVTDTGRFRFKSTNSETFSLVSKLLVNGLDHYEINLKLNRDTKESIRLKGEIYNNFKTDGRVAYYIIDSNRINELGVSLETAKNQVNLLSSMEEHDIWFLIYKKDDSYKVSLRSRRVTINEIAAKYNGGGHKLACGCKLSSLDELPKLIKDLNEAK